jgi:hypothetical protein
VLVAANDHDRPLDLGAEARAIEQAIGWSRVRAVPAATPEMIVDAVNDHGPEVLHFAGHSNGVGLYLRDDLDNELEVTAEDFRDFVENRNVRLLILNSCYSKATAEMCLPHVATVIGSSRNLSDEDACRFARELYKSLGKGNSAKQAKKDAIDVVKMRGGKDSFTLEGDEDLRLNFYRAASS